MSNEIKLLPFDCDIESAVILRKLASAHRALAELKGVAATIPNGLSNVSTKQEPEL